MSGLITWRTECPPQSVVLRWDITYTTICTNLTPYIKQTHLLLPSISESKGEIFPLPKANPSSWAELISPRLSSISNPPFLQVQPCLPNLPLLPAFDPMFLSAATPSHCGLVFSSTTSLKELSFKKSWMPSNSQRQRATLQFLPHLIFAIFGIFLGNSSLALGCCLGFSLHLYSYSIVMQTNSL